ncbi:GNAT family N-acetyltransferase [Paracoccus halophilus]|uniref:GNAT family N-acetyltransferase n=1 Tax=Paracoccus halophilus TaxID=376733 RepID=UPI001E637ABD|nr:GNAT family N-acetyltransferase [Paracoccus halophilus]
MNRPLLSLTGRLTCTDAAQMLLAIDLLSEHAQLTRAEPGNLRFDVAQNEDNPLVFELRELYADEEAFQAHRARLYDSRWGRESHGIKRDFSRTDPLPRIRAELPYDHAGISDMLNRSFGSTKEARLVDMLRRDGHLALSMVAEAAGTIIGHVALSPIAADFPALALAPVAVHPAVRGRGIGGALIRAAQETFEDHAIVVLGAPEYYGRFGFAPAQLASPYAGPHLLATGCQGLPPGSRIAHAPAFAMI